MGEIEFLCCFAGGTGSSKTDDNRGTMQKKHVCIIVLLGFFSLFLGIIPIWAQDGEQTVDCPPNSHWDGSQCTCSPGYGSRDNATCRPLAELAECPPNSHWDGSQCTCSPGYGSRDNATCRPLAELAECPPNSHWDGSQCKCSPGYGVFPGDDSCTSYRSMCKRFDSNAVYSPAKKDCECIAGYRENAAGNGCDPLAEAPASLPNTAAHRDLPETSSRQAAGPLAGQTRQENMSVRMDNFGVPRGLGQDTVVIAARSERSGDMASPVSIGGKTVYMSEAGAEAYRQRAEAGYLPVNVSIEKNTGISIETPSRMPTGRGADFWSEQQVQEHANWPRPTAHTEGGSQRKEHVPQGDNASSGWWSDPVDKPAASPNQKPTLPPARENPVQHTTKEKNDSLPAGKFQRQAKVQVQTEPAESSADKTVIPLPAFAVSRKPGKDAHRELSLADSPSFEKIVTDSLKMSSAERQDEAQEQLKTLSIFASADPAEVSLQRKDVIEVAKEGFISQEYAKEVRQWQEEIKKAAESGKVRKGVDKEVYLAEAEMEKRLKWQIDELDKTIRYSHLRLVEARGGLKFDAMARDYREHFGNRAAADDTTEPTLVSDQEMEAHKASRNIEGLAKQLKDLKAQYKKHYPQGWQEKYLDLPDKPRIETLQKKAEENIFVIFEKNMSN